MLNPNSILCDKLTGTSIIFNYEGCQWPTKRIGAIGSIHAHHFGAELPLHCPLKRMLNEERVCFCPRAPPVEQDRIVGSKFPSLGVNALQLLHGRQHNKNTELFPNNTGKKTTEKTIVCFRIKT
jgi:hypothetical protein